MGTNVTLSRLTRPGIGGEPHVAVGAVTGRIYSSNSAGQIIVDSDDVPTLIAKHGYSVSYSPEQDVFDPFTYGLRCDGKTLSDITTTSGSAAITSASYTFTQADVNKTITIAGAGASGAVLNTTISSVSAGVATLASNAGTSIAGTGVATFGMDDTTFFQKMVDRINGLGGGTIVFPAAIIVISSINWLSNVSCRGQGAGKTIFKHISTSDATTGMFNQTALATVADCHFYDFEMDMSAATAGGGYQVNAACLRITNSVRNVVERIYAHDSPATCFAFDYALDTIIRGNIIINGGRLNGKTNFGGAGIGCSVSGGTQKWIVTDNIVKNCCTYAIFWETESGSTNEAHVICNNNNVELSTASVHGIGDTGCRRFECIGNVVTSNSTANTGDAITVRSGTTGFTPGNQGTIANNTITSVALNGISIDYTTTLQAGQLCGYVIRGNKIQACTGGHGIKITSNSSNVLNTLNIESNQIQGCGFTGIILLGAGGFQDVVIKGNTIFNNGASGSGITAVGISFNAGSVSRVTVQDNDCFDNGTGAQKYGLGVNVAITGAYIEGNNFLNNATGGLNVFSGSITGIVRNNPGYNPVGISAAANVGASPATVTAGNSPETHYLNQSATNTATVTKGGQQIATLASASTYYVVELEPGEAYVVTWTTTQPTTTKDVH